MPEGGEEAVAEVDDADVVMVVEGMDNVASNGLGLHQHRIAEITTEQGGIDKAWTDVGETDVKPSLVRLLLQGLEIGGLQGFGGRIGRGWSQSFGACNGGDGSNVTFVPFGKVAIGGAYHASEAHSVGVHRAQLDACLQSAVLVSNA